MRKIYLTTAAIVAISTSTAMAADIGAMPPKAYPPVTASWTGAYVGLNAGYAWGKADQTAVDNNFFPPRFGVFATPSLKPTGFIGGGQIGYNWQSGLLVLGSEVDFSGMGVKTDQTINPFFSGKPNNSATYSSQYDWLLTARLRAGVTVAPNWLLYVTGGLAVTHVHDSISGNPRTFFGDTLITWSDSKTLYGGTIGAGMEYAFAPNWSMKVDYLYAAFNDTTPTVTSSVDLPVVLGPITSIKHNLNVVRAGINYKFGG